jgi:hypothetical protein
MAILVVVAVVVVVVVFPGFALMDYTLGSSVYVVLFDLLIAANRSLPFFLQKCVIDCM